MLLQKKVPHLKSLLLASNMMSTKLRHFNCTFETLIIFLKNQVSNGKYLYLQKKLLRANTIVSKYFHSFSVQQAPVGLFLCDSQGNTRSKKMCLPCRVYCLVSSKRLWFLANFFTCTLSLMLPNKHEIWKQKTQNAREMSICIM